MPRELFPPQTRALRTGRYATDLALPSVLPPDETAQINGALASTLRTNLQAAINGNSDKYIVLNGDARGGLCTITGESSATEHRYLLGGTDNYMPGLWLFGARRWRVSVDPNKATWCRLGTQGFRYAGGVGSVLTTVDTDDVIIDRWRQSSPGTGCFVYYNTKGNVIRDTHWQRGRYDNNGTALREHVVIARPASCYDMPGGTGTFDNPDLSNLWGLESHDLTVDECDFLDAGDPMQNVAQGHGYINSAGNWVQDYTQKHAAFLDDQNLLLRGCDFYSRRRYDSAELYGLTSEQAGADNKNGSRDPSRPIKHIDCRHFGLRIGRARAPGVGGNSLDDPGTATAGHYYACNNIYSDKCLVFDCNRAFTIGDRGGSKTGMIDSLIHHGVTRREGVVMKRISESSGASATYGFVLHGTAYHPERGRSKFTRSGILHHRQAMALTDIDPLDITDSVVLGCESHGAWSGQISASGNVSDHSNFPGSTVVDRAATLAQMGTLAVQTFDPDHLDDPDAFITWDLEKALLPGAIAPDDYIWVIGNEDTTGGPRTDQKYIPVTRAEGSPSAGLTSQGATIDGFTDNSEAHRWSAQPAPAEGWVRPVCRWHFGGAYKVLYAEFYWSWGAARQSQFDLYATDANGVSTSFTGLKSEQRGGWHRVNINLPNIVQMKLVGWGTELDDVPLNDWTSINEARFAADVVDTGDNHAPELADRQLVLQAGQARSDYHLPVVDADGDTITYSVSQGPGAAVANVFVVGALVSIYPAQNAGTGTLILMANDGRGLSNSIAVANWEIIVEAGNRPPVWAHTAVSLGVDYGTAIDLRNYVTDADGDTLHFQVIATSAGVTGVMDPDGNQLQINGTEVGQQRVTVEANDGVNAPVRNYVAVEVLDTGEVTVSDCVVEGLPVV